MIWCFWKENLSWCLNYLTRYQDKRSGLPGKPWGGSLYPPQTSPRWQNFSWYSRKVIFFGFLFFSWIRRFHTRSYLPQLPRETLWMWWTRPLLLFIPPTSIDIVTEKCVLPQDWMKRTLPAGWWTFIYHTPDLENKSQTSQTLQVVDVVGMVADR